MVTRETGAAADAKADFVAVEVTRRIGCNELGPPPYFLPLRRADIPVRSDTQTTPSAGNFEGLSCYLTLLRTKMSARRRLPHQSRFQAHDRLRAERHLAAVLKVSAGLAAPAEVPEIEVQLAQGQDGGNPRLGPAHFDRPGAPAGIGIRSPILPLGNRASVRRRRRSARRRRAWRAGRRPGRFRRWHRCGATSGPVGCRRN